MDNRTGKIINPEVFAELMKDSSFDETKFTEMKIPPTEKQLARKPPRVGRNEPCPCGSGKRFKSCHWKNPNELEVEE